MVYFEAYNNSPDFRKKSVIRSSSFIVLLSILFSGCVSNIPEQIRSAPPGSPDIEEVRSDIDHYSGVDVRWGGEIVSVKNFEAHTQVEVVARTLSSSGRPNAITHSTGRFLGNIPGFLDPAIYAEKRQITVFGTVAGSTTYSIGEYAYQSPIVNVRSHVLWQPLPQYDPYYRHHYWYVPWYGPWYDPWYRHRYWGYPYRYPYRYR